jgi:hypothetical protein
MKENIICLSMSELAKEILATEDTIPENFRGSQEWEYFKLLCGEWERRFNEKITVGLYGRLEKLYKLGGKI